MLPATVTEKTQETKAGTMLPTMTTTRLILEPLTLDDIELCATMDADPQVRRYFGPITDWDAYRERTRSFIAGPYADGLGFWKIAEKAAPGTFLGWVLLIPLAGEGPGIEIGYRLRSEVWGRGIATEAAAAVRDHGFATCGLDEIIAVTHPDNAGSQRVLEKIGVLRGNHRGLWRNAAAVSPRPRGLAAGGVIRPRGLAAGGVIRRQGTCGISDSFPAGDRSRPAPAAGWR
ncbi:MAG: hypothetical protein C0606_07385 [Hyphomicrobiales bacterium]|nr:MAG: hypothetical protein C0606_07385 [Hyphomicrobiales bacterium]